jgi:hypothetical protein
MLPLLTLIYTIPFTDETIQIDYLQIFVSLVLAVIPVIIGAIVKYKNDKAAAYLVFIQFFVFTLNSSLWGTIQH